MGVREEVEKGLVGLKDARTAAGLTQAALAELVGTDRANIAGYEAASRTLKFRMAKKLSEHVDQGSAELVLANRLAAMKRAKSEGDAAGVILAAKGILEIAGDKDLTPEGEAFLEAVADEALEFAGKSSGGRVEDAEQYDVDPERNSLGHRVGVAKAAESRDGLASATWGSLPESKLPPAEEYDPPGHDGRNIDGHRVTALEDLDDEDDFEDEDEEEIW